MRLIRLKQSISKKNLQQSNSNNHKAFQSIFLGLFVGCLLMLNCLPKLYINESYRQSLTVPVIQGMTALDRGETIDVQVILKKEKVNPAKMIVTRIRGIYLLTAEGFQNVWFLKVVGQEKASYQAKENPDHNKLRKPRFLHSESHHCAILVAETNNGDTRWFIHAGGSIARKCEDVSKK